MEQTESNGTMPKKLCKVEIFPPPPAFSSQTGVPEPCLYSGARFRGERRWGKARHRLEIELMYVDRVNEMVTGQIHLMGSAGDNPTKLAYFEGEIISKKHSFLTRKWNVTTEIDRKHWCRFDYLPLPNVNNIPPGPFNPDTFDYGVLPLNDHVYMRWKENKCSENVGFIAPGFYYVCLTKSSGMLEGIYYERNCEEWIDTFVVKHVSQKGMAVCQMR